MGTEEEVNTVLFDEEAATSLVKELRASLIDEREQEIITALRDDLSKPELESTVYEVTTSSDSVL